MALSLKDLKLVDSMYAYTKSRYIMALDCGTTSVRAVIVDEYGCIVAQASRPVKAIYPQPGWVEQDPTEILASQIAVMMEVQFKSGIHSDSIAAIGITNQRETTVVWDRDSGQPIYNAIGWQCRRTAPHAEALAQNGYADMIRAKTGLMPDAYFSATKIAWILDNVSGARELAEAGQLMFGTIDTWLIYNLTGGMVFATDYTNASRTMLFNIHTLDWDDELLELLGIPRCMLPEPRWSSGEFGRVSGEIMTHMPLITGVAGDQQASLFGHCCFEPGEAKNTYGTGCFMLMNTGDTVVESQNGPRGDRRHRGGRHGELRARGLDLPRRLRHPVAARQAAHHLERLRDGRDRPVAAGQRRLLPRPRVQRARRAVVGRGRGRAHLRPHERVRPRDHRARGLRVHGVPELRRAALHGGRRGLHARQPLGGRRRLAQTTSSCSSKPISWAFPSCRRRRWRRRRSVRPTSPALPWATGRIARRSGRTATWRAASSRGWMPRSAPANSPAGTTRSPARAASGSPPSRRPAQPQPPRPVPGNHRNRRSGRTPRRAPNARVKEGRGDAAPTILEGAAMRVAIASDHGGFDQKGEIARYMQDELACEVTDLGPDTGDSVDYPDFAAKVAHAVANGEADYGVLHLPARASAWRSRPTRCRAVPRLVDHLGAVRRALPPAQQRQRRVPSRVASSTSRTTRPSSRRSSPRTSRAAATSAASPRSWSSTRSSGPKNARCRLTGTALRRGVPIMSVSYDPERVTLVDHPLVQHKLSILRDKRTGTKQFRDLIGELALFEGLRGHARPAARGRPGGDAHLRGAVQAALGRKLAIVPILRAGLGMVDGLLELVPAARVGHIGMYRDEETHEPHEYYCKAAGRRGAAHPACSSTHARHGRVGDGGSRLPAQAGRARRAPASASWRHPRASPRSQEADPDVHIYTCSIDDGLNDAAYIVPGLGDAGDRIFGTL